MSIETIISVCTRAHRHVYTRAYGLYKAHTQNGQQSETRRINTAARNGKRGRSIVLGKRDVEGFWRRGRGRSFHVEGPNTYKAREPTVKSGTSNLEAESIRSRTESTGRCAKSKLFTDIRQSGSVVLLNVLGCRLTY